jgi:hypothetical protein
MIVLTDARGKSSASAAREKLLVSTTLVKTIISCRRSIYILL